MKTFQDCANWKSSVCDSVVKHLYELIEGKTPIYYTSADEEKALSICRSCPSYKKKTN